MSGSEDRRAVSAEAPTAQGVAELPEVLTREQAAWLLQLTPGRLDAAFLRGQIPGRQIGRRRVYSKSALLALVVGSQ